MAHDLRLALRVLGKNAGAAALSILSIALGIGLTTGVFSLCDAMLLRPMPIERPGSLLRATSFGDDSSPFLYGWQDFLDMRSSAAAVATLAAYQRRGLMLGLPGQTELALTHSVTPNYFSLLGVRAMLGQASVETVAGHPRAVIGHRLWQRRFGADANIVGRNIVLNGKQFTVAGVMPGEFTGLARGIVTDVWVSNDAWFNVLGNHEDEGRDGQFEIVARLNPGAAPQRLAAQLDAAIRGPGKRKPAPRSMQGTVLEAPFAPTLAKDLAFGGGLLLALALILLVACSNVAQMRLAQAESRKKEFGLRIALGAGAARITRQLLLETALLALAGGTLGVFAARLLLRKTAAFLTAANPFLDPGLRLDGRALAFTLAAVALSVLFSGFAPARYAARFNLAEILKSGQGGAGARAGWHTRALLIAQLAVSVTLFGAAAMALMTLRHAAAIRPGLDPTKNLFVMMVQPGLNLPSATWCEQACARLAALPGVRGATFARRLPLSGSGGGLTARVEIPGQPPRGVPVNSVGGNYFALLGTRVLAGRGIGPGDRAASALVAVVSLAFARQILPGRNPVGEWIQIDGRPRQITGVAEDGPWIDLHEPPQPLIWLPYAQAPQGDITLMAETAAAPETMGAGVSRELKRYDPRVTILTSGTLAQQLDSALSRDRMTASVAAGLGLFAVLLTAAGLFGVMQHIVNRRMREFGLRIALGARPAELQRLVLASALRVAAAGIPLGLLMLAAAAWSIRSRLFGISPLDPAAYASSAAAALAIALAAAWLPALRAMRSDPMAALRSE